MYFYWKLYIWYILYMLIIYVYIYIYIVFAKALKLIATTNIFSKYSQERPTICDN